jgi:hypothetical protein
MHISGHPYLLYILIVYSIFFLLKSKTKNEFLLILTISTFFVERNSWENAITFIATSPIRILPTDLALLILVFFVITNSYQGIFYKKLFFNSGIFFAFCIYMLINLFFGINNYGYNAIAEFRSIFYFLIIMIFISSNINKEETLYLSKQISVYLMFLILLVPLNLILTHNFSIDVSNRQFGALMYQSITLGFIVGLIYNYYIDKKLKIPFFLFSLFIATIPYTSHRTTWAALIISLLILLMWKIINKYIFVFLAFFTLFLIFINFDFSFFYQRATALYSIQTDNTGSWRILIWQAIYENASLFGNGIGSRFIVFAPIIGYAALSGAHNGFMQILYYLGYIGLAMTFILFLCFIYISLKGSYLKNVDIATSTTFRISLISFVFLVAFMIGYGFDIVSIIFISFALKHSVYLKF